jgi:GDPmannose 4,6-dehydratase
VPKTTFEELVTEMVREDFAAAERDELIKKHGYTTPNYFE